MNRILVAGATGYLGGYVARALKARGYFVRAVARAPEKLDSLRPVPDEIVRAEVTRPDTLERVCDGIDAVFSSVGITRQNDGLSFRDVDYQGNVNLLRAARRAGVEKFIYVSVFNGPALRHLEIVKAHEDFVDELKKAGLEYAVIRPTGYFSDMGTFWEMARKGRVYLVGSGNSRVNPIHGADLAEICADALKKDVREIDAGGPEILTYRQIAALAFRAVGKPVRITAVPVCAVRVLNRLVKVFDRHRADLLAFFAAAMTGGTVAPATGSRRLGAYFENLEAGSCGR